MKSKRSKQRYYIDLLPDETDKKRWMQVGCALTYLQKSLANFVQKEMRDFLEKQTKYFFSQIITPSEMNVAA